MAISVVWSASGMSVSSSDIFTTGCMENERLGVGDRIRHRISEIHGACPSPY